MVQANKPTPASIAQNKVVLPPKLSEPKTKLEFVGTSIEKQFKKTTRYLVKKFDILSPTVDDLKHPLVKRESLPTSSKTVEPIIPPIAKISQAVVKPELPPLTTPVVVSKVPVEQPKEEQKLESPEVSTNSAPPSSTNDLVVLPPLSQTENQTTAPPPPTYLHPVPGSAPPPKPLTPIPAPFSNRAAPNYNSGLDGQLVSKKKLVGYFFLGFLLNLFFFIPVVLWLAFKSKNGTKKKFLAYIVGLISSFLIGSAVSSMLSPLLTQKMTEMVPSMGYVPQALQSVYPNIMFRASVQYNKNMSNNTQSSSSEFTVTTFSTTKLSPEEIKQIGIITCDALADHNVSFDRVIVSQYGKKKVWLFSVDSFLTADQTCLEWYENDPPVLPEFPTLDELK